MIFRLSQLEFVVTCLVDIRLLVKVWNEVRAQEAEASFKSLLVLVTVEDRVPGEEVKLHFQEKQEVLDRFREALENRGLKFTCEELFPGFLTICKMARPKAN
jgi:hypothetical protein